MEEKDREIVAVKVEWFDVDARLVTACVDGDMFEMYYAVGGRTRR